MNRNYTLNVRDGSNSSRNTTILLGTGIERLQVGEMENRMRARNADIIKRPSEKSRSLFYEECNNPEKPSSRI